MKQQRYCCDANNGSAPALQAAMWRTISSLFFGGSPFFPWALGVFSRPGGHHSDPLFAASTAAHDIKIAATNELSGHNPLQSSGTL
jgi:hypothetical protein